MTALADRVHLADRAQFLERLAAALAAPRPGLEAGPALLLLDLDRFKRVKASIGEQAGEALLRAAGRRLRSALRETDAAARLGGDTFAALFAAPARREAVAALATRLLELFARPYVVNGRVALVGASIGIALAPPGGAAPETLLTDAELALRAAKAAGCGGFRFFDPSMRTEAESRRALEQELHAALPLEQFELHYQPQVALASDRLIGFEALIRWRHPVRGLMRPDRFLPLAAEIGLSSAIGEWVLRAACAEAARWPDHIHVAVNLTPEEVRSGRVLPGVARALRDSGLSGPRLEIELTETALLHPTAEALAQLEGLHRLGVRISLDDFGTGYSSLSQLRSFPFDGVKIDRRFAEDAAVLRAVAGLGEALGMRSTAEGAETPAHLAGMRRAGCTSVQGYLLGRPMPASEVPAAIAARPGRCVPAA